MKKVTLDINYKRPKPEGDEVKDYKSNIDLSIDYIYFAVATKYKDGLDNQWRRTWARLQRKLDEASENKAKTLELEDAELDFIKVAFRDAKFNPLISKYVVLFEDELESIKEK